MKWSICLVALFTVPFGCQPEVVRAEIRLPSVLGSHMVLQQAQPVPVWGWAAPGEAVTVKFAGKTVDARADKTGRWQVALPELEASSTPRSMIIDGSSGSHVELTDVLVGEVWFCTGPSNIFWPVKKCDNAAEEIRQADLPRIRFFNVERKTADEPQEDCDGHWFPCSPQTVGDVSGIGYFFSRRIHNDLDVPVGLLQSFWGGSRIEAWTSRDALEAEPPVKPILDWWQKEIRRFAPQTASEDPRSSRHRPACLYNGMVAPLIPFSIRGVICYQGLGNLFWADHNAALLETMVRDWRTRWAQDDLPVGMVQPAPFDCRKWGGPKSRPDAYSIQREAQLVIHEKLANIGIATTMDLDAIDVLHFTNKQIVGRRLADWALATVYGFDLPYAGPVYKSIAREGKSIRVRFRYTGSGLTTNDGRPPAHFEVAGTDGEFFPAVATIDGHTVLLESDHVANPEAVRFAFTDTAVVNLMNRQGLPASLFRSNVAAATQK
jgi:sialate O-acetylesterase